MQNSILVNKISILYDRAFYSYTLISDKNEHSGIFIFCYVSLSSLSNKKIVKRLVDGQLCGLIHLHNRYSSVHEQNIVCLLEEMFEGDANLKRQCIVYQRSFIPYTITLYIYIVGHNGLRPNISPMFHNQPNRLRYS